MPESGIMERRNQRHVSRLRRPFPLSSLPLGPLSSPIFFPVSHFSPFPHSGAWSQAKSSQFPHTPNTKAANSKAFTSNCVTIQLTVRAWTLVVRKCVCCSQATLTFTFWENVDTCSKGYLLVTRWIANLLMGFRGPKRHSDFALLNRNTWSELEFPRRLTTKKVFIEGRWKKTRRY